MTLFLDTEFNGHGGQLISLAIVSNVYPSEEWYGVLPLPKKIHPWVKENVIPVLNAEPMETYTFLNSFREFINVHSWDDIVADWPADITHLMNCLYDYQGFKYYTGTLHLRLIPQEPGVLSEIPHNALEDAKGLMRHWNSRL